MVSYVDVLTILLIFFLVAAAKTLEVPKARAAVPAQACIQRTEAQPPRTSLMRAQERLRERGLDPKLEPRGLVISLPQVILFSSGEDAVSPQALPTIAQIADVLREIPNDVRLIGYADPVPIHNRRFRSNWDLSMARSQKILNLLSSRYGIPESRLSIASYGPYRPAVPNDTVDGRASNRRVEIVILDDSHPTGEPA
jgi:chemotaxis protein MotB